jgi:hypothetical protein
MKKVIMTIAVLALLAGSAYAGPNYYVAMYNAGEDHDACGVSGIVAPYTPYEMWIWILPGDEGLKGFDFKLDLAGDIVTVNTDNPDLSVTINSPQSVDGWVGTFSGCFYDWVWLTKLNILAASVTPHYVTIIDNPTTGAVEATDCTPGYPIRDLIVLNQYGVNQDCLTDSEDSSWGAVKALYR